MQFPDGDNWGDADNRRCVDLVREMLIGAATVGYAEIGEGGYRSPLLAAFGAIQDERFITLPMQERKDIHGALKRFFHGSAGGA